MAGALKKRFPECRVVFLGRKYTRDVISLSTHVDKVLVDDDLGGRGVTRRRDQLKKEKADIILHVFPRRDIARDAFLSRIPHRVGTRSRWYHWIFCNHLMRLPRRSSRLHEAQLNLKMLRFLDMPVDYAMEDIRKLYGFTKIPPLREEFAALLHPGRVNVILHPLSKGSAAEWGLPNFSALLVLLPAEKYKVFVSGTREDGLRLRGFFEANQGAHDITGLMDLSQFIAFISRADVLVAASTGPLHIAAALGVKAVGLYSARRPIFPARWAPIGERAHAIVHDTDCAVCSAGKTCDCVSSIAPERVLNLIEQ
jgi:heptosyltransferase III